MIKFSSRLFVLLTAVFVPLHFALAVPYIDDSAHLFSSQAVHSAEQASASLADSTKSHKAVYVKTVENLPGEDAVASAERYFNQARLNGVLIYIVKNPHKLVVTNGKTTDMRGALGDTTRNIMLTEFRSGNYDSGLAQGMTYLTNQLTKNFSGAASTSQDARSLATLPYNTSYPSSSGESSWITWLLLIGGAFLLIRMVKSLFGSSMGGTGMGQQRGGMGSSLLSGLFGAVAGNWIYDQFFHSGAHASTYDPTANQTGFNNEYQGGQSDNGEVGSSSSGDWNDNSSSDWSSGNDGGGGSSGGDW